MAEENTGLLTSRPREMAIRRFRVEVLAGPDKGKDAASDGSEFTIGTGVGNQLVLQDKTVSRIHCSITWSSRGFLLRDLESTNGTTLAGFRVEAAYLKPGAVIGVGITQLRFGALEDVVRQPLSEQDRFGRALGCSPAMRQLFANLPVISGSNSTVLIEGETGTGKSLLAEAIHNASARASGPFMVIDCSSIPPTLIESELFGHEKGAFTGAHAARAGVLKGASGGTVFLDEIGELPFELQPKLLGVLEERTIRPVGGAAPIRLDVRVIAATNRDLRKQINEGTFRSDLYYRLKIVGIRIPPLRERKEDIEFLARHFFEQFVEGGEPPQQLLDRFARRDWPGNVRELRNAVEQAVLLGGSPDLPMSIPPSARGTELPRVAFDPSQSFRAAKEYAIGDWERQYVEWLLKRNDFNLSKAAREARTDRNYLRELARRHRIPIGND